MTDDNEKSCESLNEKRLSVWKFGKMGDTCDVPPLLGPVNFSISIYLEYTIYIFVIFAQIIFKHIRCNLITHFNNTFLNTPQK